MSEFLDTAAIHDINGADLPDHATWGDGTVTQPHEILLSAAPCTGGRQTYRIHFRGELLLVSWDPGFDACRRLLADGYAGHLQTRWAGAKHAAMRMTIAAGAMRATYDGASGVRIVKWRPFQHLAVEDPAGG